MNAFRNWCINLLMHLSMNESIDKYINLSMYWLINALKDHRINLWRHPWINTLIDKCINLLILYLFQLRRCPLPHPRSSGLSRQSLQK